MISDQAASAAAPAPSSKRFERRREPLVRASQSSDRRDTQNVADSERIVSVAAGSILGFLGVARRDGVGLLIAGVGGALIHRGLTGHCYAYDALEIDTAEAEQRARVERRKPGSHVAQSFLIDKSPEELYTYWRNFEQLPKIMSHLESVRVLDERRSHWVAKAPRIAGGQVEWDAEITEDEPNKRISWRSLPGSDVDTSGSVSFVRAPGDRGTKVRVVLDYEPPGGQLGKWIATLFGEAPERTIREDLRNFKRVMEVGEIPTIEGQPQGTCLGWGRRDGG